MKRALLVLVPLLFVSTATFAEEAPAPKPDTAGIKAIPAPVIETAPAPAAETAPAPAPAVATPMPEVGTVAPDVALPSQDGKTVRLGDYRGKWVVLYFYPKDFTGGCTLEAHNFQRDLAKFKEQKAVVVGVSLDSVDSHQAFCSKESLEFKLLSDAGHTVATKYGTLRSYEGQSYASRSTFLIDPKGVIRKVYVKVDPAIHSEAVLSDLAQLAKAKKS
ncbi:MAG: peroxiredoxin [Candidatus Eisenbacteria bacterium]